MATAKPGPILGACVAYASGERDSPPPISQFRGSYNFLLLSHLTAALHGRSEDADALEGMLRSQLDGRAGLFADEAGGSYAHIQIEVALVLIRLDRDGRLGDAGLGAVARRWFGAVVYLLALLAVPFRGSVLVAGPGSRLRYPVADGISVVLQLMLGELPRRFGIRGGSKPDAVTYDWKGAEDQADRLLKLIGVPPQDLAAECGVSRLELRSVVFESSRTAIASALARHPLRSLHPLRIRRYRSGVLAAWWESFTSHDAPHAGAVVEAGGVRALQPQPIGPRAYNPRKPDAPWDHQHWGGSNEQRGFVEGDRLVGEFRTRVGKSSPGDEGDPTRPQLRWTPLPPGEPVLSLVIDQDGAREEGASAPPPRVHVPVEPPHPGAEPKPEPPRGGEGELVATRAQIEAVLAFLDTMIAGEAGRGASSRLRAMIADLLR